ncbi:MAG: hypothetical protein FWG90_09530 [Oscillospiraceae bacterium]|nr:hypothetical protein [Oscillospiraceae bacterium]
MSLEEKLRVKKLSWASKNLKPQYVRIPDGFCRFSKVAAIVAVCGLLLGAEILFNELLGGSEYMFTQHWVYWVVFTFLYLIYGFFTLLNQNLKLGFFRSGVISADGETKGYTFLGGQLAALPFNAKDFNNMLFLKWQTTYKSGIILFTLLTSIEFLDYRRVDSIYMSQELAFFVLAFFQTYSALYLVACINKSRRVRLGALWAAYFLTCAAGLAGQGYGMGFVSYWFESVAIARYVSAAEWLLRYAAIILPYWMMSVICKTHNKKTKNVCWRLD